MPQVPHLERARSHSQDVTLGTESHRELLREREALQVEGSETKAWDLELLWLAGETLVSRDVFPGYDDNASLS